MIKLSFVQRYSRCVQNIIKGDLAISLTLPTILALTKMILDRYQLMHLNKGRARKNLCADFFFYYEHDLHINLSIRSISADISSPRRSGNKKSHFDFEFDLALILNYNLTADDGRLNC
jgi:hypothetical protein